MKHSIFPLLFFLSTTLAFSQDRKTIKFVDEYLNSALWEVNGANQPLIKWNSNIKIIRYKIIGDSDFMSDRAWDKYLSEIKELTGIELAHTNQDDFQILIFFGELDDYGELTGNQIPLQVGENFNNWSSRNWDSKYNLIKASFCIVPDKIKDDVEGTHRVKKGILKALGLLGETEDEYSIFYKYPASTNTGISRNDKRIIKLHYNPIVEAGSSKEDVKQALLDLPDIKELSKERL